MARKSNRLSRYPFTAQVLAHIHRQGWTVRRKEIILNVFGDVMEWETGVNSAELLERAEQIELASIQCHHAVESVEELVESVRRSKCDR